MSTPDWLEELDHTGDAGIAVTAPNLETLFERAAWGTFNLIADLEAVNATIQQRVEVEASDRAALLVTWLSELNYRHLTQHMLYVRFRVLELSDNRLMADVFGEPIDAERHTVHTEIKAVTYHGLQIARSAGEWSSQIIFDM